MGVKTTGYAFASSVSSLNEIMHDMKKSSSWHFVVKEMKSNTWKSCFDHLGDIC